MSKLKGIQLTTWSRVFVSVRCLDLKIFHQVGLPGSAIRRFTPLSNVTQWFHEILWTSQVTCNCLQCKYTFISGLSYSKNKLSLFLLLKKNLKPSLLLLELTSHPFLNCLSMDNLTFRASGYSEIIA